MVSGKSETASEAGGWTFSRFIVEDRRIGGSGGARSSAPLLRTLVLQRQKALFDPLEMSQHGGDIRIGQIRQHAFFASGQFLTDFCDSLHSGRGARDKPRSEEHTSELQSLMRISNDVFCLKKKR